MTRALGRSALVALLAGASTAALGQTVRADRDTAVAGLIEAANRLAGIVQEANRELAVLRRMVEEVRHVDDLDAGVAGDPPAPEQAAPVASPVDGRTASGALRRAVNDHVAHGTNDSVLQANAAPQFDLLAAGEEQVASLAVSFRLGGQYRVLAGERRAEVGSDQFRLTASGRLNDGESRLLGLQGFPNGTEIRLSYTHYGTVISLDDPSGYQEEQARLRCERAPPEERAEGCVPSAYRPAEGPQGASAFIRRYYPDGFDAMAARVLPRQTWFLGAELAADQSKFGFLDRARFALVSESHLEVDGTIFGGLIFPHHQTAIIGSLQQGRSFEARDEVTLCQPIAGTTLTQCLTGPDGRPVRSRTAIAALEFRHAFGRRNSRFPTNLAIAPRFAYDIEDDAYSIDMPVYFGTDAAGALRAGIRGIFVSQPRAAGGRDEDFSLALFVGVPFSLFRN